MTKYNQIFKQQVVSFYFEHHENRPFTLYCFNLSSTTVMDYAVAQVGHLSKKNGIQQSISRKGNCLDDTAMESFFGRMKTECFYGKTVESIDNV